MSRMRKPELMAAIQELGENPPTEWTVPECQSFALKEEKGIEDINDTKRVCVST